MNIIPYENEKPLTRSEYDKIRETALEGISRTRREHILSVEREAVMMSETLFPFWYSIAIPSQTSSGSVFFILALPRRFLR